MQNNVTLLDGAMGTELTRRGIDTTLPLWSAHALISAPDAVRQIHADYIAAGAQIVTTNTFRTNVRALAKANLQHRARELTLLAAQLARDAIAQVHPAQEALVAGSIAPVEDCYTPELAPDADTLLAEHSVLARNLADAGCDLILIETMNTIREATAAAHAAHLTGKPIWISFTLGADHHLLSGESLRDAVRAIASFAPQAVLVNCIPVAQVSGALAELCAAVADLRVPFGAYGNVGHVNDEVGWTLTDAVSPVAYAQAAVEWRALGAGIIGGCCGTTPEHIRALKATA